LDPDVSGENEEQLAFTLNAFLEASPVLEIPPNVKQEILASLSKSLGRVFQEDARQLRPINVFTAGNGFYYLMWETKAQIDIPALWDKLCEASAFYGSMLPFWQAVLLLAEQNTSDMDLSASQKELFHQAIMQCLGSPSHDMRLVGLSILEKVCKESADSQNIIATALLIEQTPFNMETARSISMRIRQLAKLYPTVKQDEWAGEAIPTFCFGLLHVRLAQIWDDACSALTEMSETKEGEAHISRIAFDWINLGMDGPISKPSDVEDAQSPSRRATDFECTNIMQLERTIAKSRSLSDHLQERLKADFDRQHAQLPFITPFSRTQALRLLNDLPQLAEKRSRLLVPVLLKWVAHQPSDESLEHENTDSDNATSSQLRWARKDQKSLLSIVSKFNNPRVLFKSAEVYEALLVLLGNGDVEIQKAALKGLLAWKDAAIVRYQENLVNLLDDARFREEVSVFMDVSDDETHLREEHRDHLLPVILRLLYGKIVSGKRGQEAKRKAVFIALTRFSQDAIRQFLSIAFGPLDGLSIVQDERVNEKLFEIDLSSPRKQVGMLNMLEDMLRTLKTTITPFVSCAIDPLLYCLIKASRVLAAHTTPTQSEDDSPRELQVSLMRTIRQRGFHSLNILFESCPEFSWETYVPVIVEELVTPRLQQFPVESANSVSGLLRLFAAWSRSSRTAPYLVQYDSGIIGKIMECLNGPSTKDEVKKFILDEVLTVLIATAARPDEASAEELVRRSRIHTDILQPHSNAILGGIGDLLQKSPSKDLLESGVQAIAELAPYVAGSTETRSMIEIATFLLKQPSKRVSPQIKPGLLKILHEFIPRCEVRDMDALFDTVFEPVSSLFSTFREKSTRTLLCDLIRDLSDYNDEVGRVAELCYDLNSFSHTRLDEPDFDRRSRAFNIVSGSSSETYSLRQWKPIVYNMLYYIKDNEELSIRVNSSVCLKRFVEASRLDDSFKDFLASALLPGIHNGVRESSELVRLELLTVLASLIKLYPDWSLVSDMHILLGPDDESSFFNNILHIQGHRRLRALRRLATDAPQLQSRNIYHLLLPLLEHFIFNKAEDEAAHNLAGETIRAVTSLSQSLEWPQFRSMLKRFIGYLKTKEDMQKTIIRLLTGMMDTLKQAGVAKGYMTCAPINPIEAKEQDVADGMVVETPLSSLTKTLPQQEKLTLDLTGNLLPPLTDFLHNKDESTVSLRAPIAVAVTKVLLVLPAKELENRLPAVLLDICHILKSRSQDGRDMARNTLAEIATLTGPPYLGFILKSLRTALQRGYQLHVLSFTLHHILVHLSATMQPGDLDYCLSEMVDVVMDDTFGVTGQEKDAEEYISKMREVKSSKSYDSIDILARFTLPTHLVNFVLPLKSLLLERLNGKMVQKIDELLRRIGLGILQNQRVEDREILVFCYELIQDVYKTNSNPDASRGEDSKNRRYLVNMRGAAKSGVRGSTSSHIYKITRFSLDILRTVLRKHEELQTPQNLAGFLPIIGDALIQGHEEVQVSALRLVTTIIKVPLAALDKDCPVYVTEAVRIIKNTTSTNTEIAQAALKLVSAILRERPNVEVKERDLAFLLKRLIPDLDEPDRQGVTFGFLKAVMNRKIIITEIYEVMDRVAAIMVTNHTRSARDLARSSYFHFLMEYPQAKNRFTKQLEFLIRNLRYDHVEGRQSVMEALNLILNKVGDEVLQDVLGMMFIPLIHSMANDDSSDCRTMAGALVKKLFERADAQRSKNFTSDLRSWLQQDDDSGLQRLGIQCWGLYFEVAEAKPKDLTFVMDRLQATVEECLQRRDEDDWELLYYSLTVFSKLCKTASDVTLSAERADLWTGIESCVSYPHGWVKLTAAKLVGTFFAHLASANAESGLDALPLQGSNGLKMTEEIMIRLTNAFVKNLSIPGVTEELCTQSVRNLAFLARCLAVNGAKWDWYKVDDDDEVEDGATEKLQTAANGDAPSSDEEWGGFSPPPETRERKSKPEAPTAIHRLMTRLSGLIRRETKIMKLSSLWPKSAVMTLLETLTSKLPTDAVTSSLPHLLTTLSTLVDPATTIPRSTDSAFNDTYKGLLDKAREVMDTLQKRLGTSQYLAFMEDVQKGVRQRREDRRTKRKVEAITMPEKYGKEKKRRHDVARQRKKEKSAASRGQRRGW
jgi:U3 small nucleolar RNA-associated protein 20